MVWCLVDSTHPRGCTLPVRPRTPYVPTAPLEPPPPPPPSCTLQPPPICNSVMVSNRRLPPPLAIPQGRGGSSLLPKSTGNTRGQRCRRKFSLR